MVSKGSIIGGIKDTQHKYLLPIQAIFVFSRLLTLTSGRTKAPSIFFSEGFCITSKLMIRTWQSYSAVVKGWEESPKRTSWAVKKGWSVRMPDEFVNPANQYMLGTFIMCRAEESLTECPEYCAVIEGFMRRMCSALGGCKCGETAGHRSLSVKGYCQMSRDVLRCSTEWMVLYDGKWSVPTKGYPWVQCSWNVLWSVRGVRDKYNSQYNSQKRSDSSGRRFAKYDGENV